MIRLRCGGAKIGLARIGDILSDRRRGDCEMPVKTDSLGRKGHSGLTRAVIGDLRSFRRRILTGTALLTGSFLGSTLPVLAQAAGEAASSSRFSSYPSLEVVNFAMVIGAISAAMISAIWLIRERGKIDARKHVELRDGPRGRQREDSRAIESLIVDRDRQIVVWDGVGLPAEVLGKLSAETGAPQNPADFLAFGRWLEPSSAAAI
jgi:hypothetical protein